MDCALQMISPEQSRQLPAGLPLCVDLDGTLVRTDLFVESLLRAVRQKPWILALLPLWLLRGKAYLKAALAVEGQPDFEVLPYNDSVVELVRNARSEQRAAPNLPCDR